MVWLEQSRLLTDLTTSSTGQVTDSGDHRLTIDRVMAKGKPRPARRPGWTMRWKRRSDGMGDSNDAFLFEGNSWAAIAGSRVPQGYWCVGAGIYVR